MKELCAAANGILAGREILLDDQPKLIVKSEALRGGRILRGMSPNPIKVGVAAVVDISLESDFIALGWLATWTVGFILAQVNGHKQVLWT
jgi:hypothetical protein